MEKEMKSEIKKETAERSDLTRTSEYFDEAIRAVYRKYGTDLPAFFRDAFREAARKHKKAANPEVHPQ